MKRVQDKEGLERETAGTQRGSALPLLALSLALVIVSALMLGMVAGRAVDRSAAQSAADAAALAGVAEGEAAARSMAERNGAQLVSFVSSDNTVVVEVDLAGVRAVADAKRSLILDP